MGSNQYLSGAAVPLERKASSSPHAERASTSAVACLLRCESLQSAVRQSRQVCERLSYGGLLAPSERADRTPPTPSIHSTRIR